MSAQTLQHNRSLWKLLIARNITAIIILIVFAWFEQYTGQHYATYALALWFALTTLQIVLLKVPQALSLHTIIQLCSDLILLGFIVYASSGLNSPFIFLLGLVVILAGSQASILLTLGITTLASITYLIAVYASLDHITTEITLKMLLQTSLLLLTGGIMAIIARRHAQLKEREQQTSQAHKQLQEVHWQVLQAMQEGIVTLQRNLHIQAFNPAAAKLLRLSPSHIHTPLQDVLQLPESLIEHSQCGQPQISQHEISFHQLHLLLTLTPLHDDKHATWLLTLVDVTQTRQLERQLAEQDKLASIGQMAAMLAHEIRNPMQTIAQAAELMSLEQPNNQLEHLITSEIARLNRLVSNILDYAHPLHPSPKNVHIKDLLQSSIQQADLQNTHQIRLEVEKNANIKLDPDHIRLILDNLLRNAMRASPEPASITVVFSQNADSWQLKVADKGPGIPEHMRDHIFQPFTTGHQKGSGLGLATVWQVCQANQWKVWVETSDQTGTCFIVQGKVAASTEKRGT